MSSPPAAPPPRSAERPARSAHRPVDCPVYPIADAGVLGEAAVPAAVAAMARAGARWIQLRAKRVPDRRFLELASVCLSACLEACRESLDGTAAASDGGALRLWIDDRPDVAALLASDRMGASPHRPRVALGVHLGQDDLPPGAVRELLGGDVWIGRSTHGREQLLAAHRDPAVDVVAIGPVFETSGKESPDPVVGLDTVRWAREATDKPLVAIGGIGPDRIASVLDAGADAAAVISAVCRGDVEENVRRLVAAAGPGITA